MDNIPKKGDTIYVGSSYSISNGSSDVCGGKATVDKVEDTINGVFVSVKEHPGHSYNWKFLDQEKLKKEYGDAIAHPCPDVDTPWIEDGDVVDGKVYHGKPIW